MRNFGTSVLLAALCAGCVATPAPSSVETERRISGRMVRKVATVPTRVNLLLPPALALAAGAGRMRSDESASLIGNDAGSLLGNDAGSMITAGGGNMVAAGGGNYIARRTLLQSECGPVISGQQSFVQLVGLNASAYLEMARIVNAMLKAVATQSPDADTAFSFQTPAGDAATAMLTHRGEGGGLLRLSAGDTFNPDNLIVALAYESATKGRFVYRSPDAREPFGRLTIASTFDLATGLASADGASDASTLTSGAGPRTRVHWEFSAGKGENAPFTMKASAFFRFIGEPCESGARAMTVKVGTDGRGAARMVRVLPGESEPSFTRNDGGGYTAETGTNTGFFLAKNGSEIKADAAGPALTTRLPGRADIYTPFPADPGETGEMGTDAHFAWPE